MAPEPLRLDIAERILHPAMPKLQNTDGEPVELHTLVFRVDHSAAAATALDAAKLRVLAAADRLAVACGAGRVRVIS